jgi:5-methylcytosine-specific restriction endonuclease McrA
MRWKWDQGRLQYFQFENIQKIASTLYQLEGVDINQAGADPFRDVLMTNVSMPFSPSHYRVWRNYGRVFECMRLCTSYHGRLVCTDLCKVLASGTMSSNEYFLHTCQKFYLNSPIFKDQSNDANQIAIFPFVMIIKFLIAKARQGIAFVGIDDVFRYVIGSNLTGFEPIDDFSRLHPTQRTPDGDEYRQVREMLAFISQLEFLSWNGSQLSLDIDISRWQSLESIAEAIAPELPDLTKSREDQILALGSYTIDENQHRSTEVLEMVQRQRLIESDELFIEGKRNRITHLVVERSRKVRERFLRERHVTHCDMCTMYPPSKYRWVESLLEVHHLLPLSSPIYAELKGTSLDNLVGLCPNCHRSTHIFYSKWFKERGLQDFPSHDIAKSVYFEAKSLVA